MNNWKTLSAYRKHKVEVLRANRHQAGIVHVEGLEPERLKEMRVSEEEVEEEKG